MLKICILLFSFSFAIPALAQRNLNPKIGKNEFEISLFYFGDKETGYIGTGQHLAGAQIVRRWSWTKYTKIGVGGLTGVINHDPIYESDVVAYGALFGDITQFVGKPQKWSFSGQIGHGIFKRERKTEEATYKGVDKHTAGMYYSISINYCPAISKKILMVISPAYTFRNFRRKATEEYYSPPSVNEYKSTYKHSGPGIRLGIVF